MQRCLSCSGHVETSVGNPCDVCPHRPGDGVTHSNIARLYDCFVSVADYFLSLGVKFSSFLSFLSLLHAHEQATKEKAFFRERMCVKT